MRRSLHAAHVYMILGVISGLYYRELTKAHHFEGETQLSVVHTHLLALGMLVFLIVLALDKLFRLSGSRHFTAFFWTYNAGLALTVLTMTYRGTMTVLGHSVPEAVSGIAGLGHIVITVGLVLLFTLLGKRVPATHTAADPEAVAESV
ncbi:DUF2871 domain-containing protein [Kitasatospora camelliae]|uniref:DUF2871 domain-containing protein n=1 Tax=Kitasatospora camelliae TaxID=3156397 RepID=A0AAU8JPE7_9ACTN